MEYFGQVSKSMSDLENAGHVFSDVEQKWALLLRLPKSKLLPWSRS